MLWSPQQDDALCAVDDWLADGGRQTFYLAGYAGTGKTTLARHLAQNVDGDVYFAAYTGKAAHVLRQKGCIGASTIHSLIYISNQRSMAEVNALQVEIDSLVQQTQAFRNRDDVVLSEEPLYKQMQERLVRARKELEALKAESKMPMFKLNPLSEARGAALIVIDECSMVGEQMGRDLESFGVPILVLGDPAQLPPVGSGGYFTDRKPDVLLTEIHRQARESPILRLATLAREMQNIPYGELSSTCKVIPYGDRSYMSKLAMEADQILVGRNKTRHASNARYRELLRAAGGLAQGGPYPQQGDKLVCLRNDHDMGLLNGALWRVLESVVHEDTDTVTMEITSAEDATESAICCEAHLAHFVGKEADLNPWTKKDFQEFDYGYALTVHKSQGSQWDNVLLFDESGAFRDQRWKWLYTGITRAAEGLIIVR